MPFSIAKYHFTTDAVIQDLPAAELKLLKANMQRIEVKKGKTIFRENTFSKGIYIVRKGKVKVYQTNKDGKEAIAYFMRKGEIIGYRPLLCDEPYAVSCAALEDVVLTFVAKKYFLQALDNSPVLCRRLLVSLSHEFSVLINTISFFAQQPVRERVALALLILNEKYKKENTGSAPGLINLSRDNIANYAGTTIETLVRMLRHLKDEKIIRTEGRRIILLRIKELEKMVELY